ncbi:hypothetical protein ROLI_013210 [Roseobacter fucihabitans]|uniref:HTH-like domain-containing protein n=1 Tax=Roseobacter fucihabitans TaxID=1537242 RepID=A0ABZ2BQI4_9RHOB|nr:hypothetical protein [Roseobacter litoralis]
MDGAYGKSNRANRFSAEVRARAEDTLPMSDRVLFCRASQGCLNCITGAQSTFYAHAAILKNPDLASDRAKRDADLSPEIKRVWKENNEVYGIRKTWHQLQREGFNIARCTVAR